MDLLAKILINIVNPILETAMGVAVLFFIYGIVEYIWKGESGEEREKSSKHILWGLIGLAIMISAVALVNFVSSTITSTVRL